MKEPNFAPVYCAMYPGLTKIVRKHGYALAVHGSLIRDMDLICVPWIENPSDPLLVIKEITEVFAIECLDLNPTIKNHGRIVWTISITFGECAIDLSFMPRSVTNSG